MASKTCTDAFCKHILKLSAADMLQVKRQCNSCGYGGDWALQLKAEHLAPKPDTESEAASETTTDSDAAPAHRVTLLLYLADESAGSADMEVLPEGGRTSGGAAESSATTGRSSRLVAEGRHATVGNYQLHLAGSSGRCCKRV